MAAMAELCLHLIFFLLFIEKYNIVSIVCHIIYIFLFINYEFNRKYSKIILFWWLANIIS